MAGTMNVRLRVWRQKDARSPGGFVTYEVKNISPDMSFLEMLDTLNEELIGRGEEPIAFDHDCREGICGMCSLVINGQAHGPTGPGVTTCQLYMRHFRDGEEITVEPFRAKAFPIIRDLVVDRSALDRVVAAGGFISVNIGGAPDANAIPVSKEEADASMDAAACIGCGACVAACPNGSAMLFVGAQISKYLHLPQGRVERERRVVNMVRAMDEQGFGNCTNHRECEAVCPKNIPIKVIAEMNREFIRAKAKGYR